ncbi:hypothetical protein BAE44_0017635, partial [Dichanthelium oligosanthes]
LWVGLLDDTFCLSVLAENKEVAHGADGADLEEALVLCRGGSGEETTRIREDSFVGLVVLF